MASDPEEAALRRLRAAAVVAVQSIGLGFDMVMDYRLDYCKNPIGSRLIDIDEDRVKDLAVPGGIIVPNVPDCINCGKGERIRFSSDVLSFLQMSEVFNMSMSLSGKIPNGHFNAAFEFTGQWQKDAACTKGLAFDRVSITLYSIELEKLQILLSDNVKQEVPTSWDPVALARFIEKYGTHIITGLKMGGEDAVYLKQHSSSPLSYVDLQKILKDVAERRFNDACEKSSSQTVKTYQEAMLERIEHGLAFMDSSTLSIYSHKEDITLFWRRRGGSKSRNMAHNEWCQSVKLEPDVISMSFIPIASLLNGVNGSGFLSHAINLYLRYKPPVEVLHQFLDFQLPKQWAPVFGDLPLSLVRHLPNDASLQFRFLGPKLYVNTDLVDAAKRPVTGARLYLEGRKSNQLAINLKHMSSCPVSLGLENKLESKSSDTIDKRYNEKVRWKLYSHVCTAPVESEDDLSIVTGAQFQVKKSGGKNILLLRLYFTRVSGPMVLKNQEWDGPSQYTEKSGLFSSFISSITISGEKPPPRPADVNINSALYQEGPPCPVAIPDLLRFVDSTERERGPQDFPGFWLLSGARLGIDNGKISLSVKYSLLAVDLPKDRSEI